MINLDFFTYDEFINELLVTAISEQEKLPVKERDVELLKDFKSQLKKGKKSFETWKVRILDSKDKIPNFYNAKRNEYLRMLPEATEMHFLNDSLNECQLLLDRQNKLIDEYKPKSKIRLNPNMELIELKKEKFLLSEYLEYLKVVKVHLDNYVQPEIFIANLDMEQFGRIDNNKVRIINDEMKLRIKSKFKYFEDKYKSNWGGTIQSIYSTITFFYHEIGEVSIGAKAQKYLLKTKLDIAKRQLEFESLKGVESFFEFLLSNEPNDCRKAIVVFRSIMKDYEFLLSYHNYDFKNSFFYPTIKNFYDRMELEYNIDRLKSSTPVSNTIKLNRESKTEQEQPRTFEELFFNPEHAEPCLKILNELQPPVIDAINNFIGKSKGVFPMWINVLKNHKPTPLIRHVRDIIYKDLLNEKIKGLNLSKDASEFRKQYKRLQRDNIYLDMKTLLSQYSQSGKLGK